MALLCAAALLGGCATGRPLTDRYVELVGEYRGLLRTGDKTYPVMTHFRFNKNGVLQGVYTFAEGTNNVTGVLYDFRNASDDSVDCAWHDDYGIGILKLKFSDDLRRFTGRWGTNGKVFPGCSWDGFRFKSGIEKTIEVPPLPEPEDEIY